MDKISNILYNIDVGTIALPEFQRGYVWNRDQVRSFMTSLYKKHPVGSLLVWLTKSETTKVRGGYNNYHETVKLLLDGQQRITTLYGIIKGEVPNFFDGDRSIFTGLYFNVETEIFKFYAPMEMKDNPLWINVSQLMKDGLDSYITIINTKPEWAHKVGEYIKRLVKLDSIKDIMLHIEEVNGDDKTVDIVADIFNKVNSGGTKLSKGDLALAKICAGWAEAREEMKKRITKWEKHGFNFKLELLLRCITAVLKEEASFSALKDIKAEDFEKGLKKTETLLDSCINLISSRLGLDHDRVLGSRYSLPLMTAYFNKRGGKINDLKERDRLLYWYIHTFLWGRYAGSTESVLNQDLEAIKDIEQGVINLINNVKQSHGGDLEIRPDDFKNWSTGARFYPFLYMMTRVWHAKDFESGIELSRFLLGHNNSLELHHIFPKSKLYAEGYKKHEVNALANLTFLTKGTHGAGGLSDMLPEEYLPKVVSKGVSLLESHWIPLDRELWKLKNYSAFLSERRNLLAIAANAFMDELNSGKIPEVEVKAFNQSQPSLYIGLEDNDLIQCNKWIEEQGLPSGEFSYELINEKTREVISILDLCWLNGLQEGLSQPVAILVDESGTETRKVFEAGYKVFTDILSFKDYVRQEILEK